MLDTVTLLTFLAMGILLCFYGFRMFRFSMALAGFFMGFQAANLIDSLFLLENIPEKMRSNWEFFFPIILGLLLLAALSYALYKKALFFITVFFTWYSIVKIFLLYIIKTQNNLKLVVSLSPDLRYSLQDQVNKQETAAERKKDAHRGLLIDVGEIECTGRGEPDDAEVTGQRKKRHDTVKHSAAQVLIHPVQDLQFTLGNT